MSKRRFKPLKRRLSKGAIGRRRERIERRRTLRVTREVQRELKTRHEAAMTDIEEEGNG